jgi:PD-(D/E)XK nuclease superfamily
MKLNLVFDMTKYDLFRLCEARYNFRHNLNIGLAGAKSERLDRGSLVHVGCEVYFQALKEHKHYDDAVGMALSKIREAGVISTDLDNDVINRVIEVMEEYFDYWRIADQGYEIIAVEQPFMKLLFENDDIRLYLAGKIDLVTSDNQYINMPTDHKSYDRSYTLGRMVNQFKCYCYILESNYLVVDKIGFQKTLKPHEKFLRPKLTFDPLYLNEWKQNVINTIVGNYLHCVSENIWPMNETSCDKFNRQCEYYAICDSSGLPAKNWKINSEYVQSEPWDVTKAMMKSTEKVELDKKKQETNGEVNQSHSQATET